MGFPGADRGRLYHPAAEGGPAGPSDPAGPRRAHRGGARKRAGSRYLIIKGRDGGGSQPEGAAAGRRKLWGELV